MKRIRNYRIDYILVFDGVEHPHQVNLLDFNKKKAEEQLLRMVENSSRDEDPVVIIRKTTAL